MDPALYALIGALGGILITQVANYFLEDKKSKNLIDLKKLDVTHEKSNELHRERRSTYAKYLVELDVFSAHRERGLDSVINEYYNALIVANDETSEHIKTVFSIIKKDDFETDDFLKAKKALLQAMRNEL